MTPQKGWFELKAKLLCKVLKIQISLQCRDKKPAHQVQVDGFFIDATEVTNEDFIKFVEVTNYITIAERKIDWEVMKSQVPEGTPKPHDSILQPGSLVFNANQELNIRDIKATASRP